MLLRQSIQSVFLGVAASLVTSAAFAASGGQPLVLDTQRGISDGHSGTVLQTAPLSHAPIVQAQPIAAPSCHRTFPRASQMQRLAVLLFKYRPRHVEAAAIMFVRSLKMSNPEQRDDMIAERKFQRFANFLLLKPLD